MQSVSNNPQPKSANSNAVVEREQPPDRVGRPVDQQPAPPSESCPAADNAQLKATASGPDGDTADGPGSPNLNGKEPAVPAPTEQLVDSWQSNQEVTVVRLITQVLTCSRASQAITSCT